MYTRIHVIYINLKLSFKEVNILKFYYFYSILRELISRVISCNCVTTGVLFPQIYHGTLNGNNTPGLRSFPDFFRKFEDFINDPQIDS